MLVALTAVSGAKADYPASITVTFKVTDVTTVDYIVEAFDQANGIYIGSVTTTVDWQNFWLTDGETYYSDNKNNSHTLVSTSQDHQNCWAEGTAGHYTVYVDLKNLKWSCHEDGSITMGSEKWMTCYSDYAYIMPEGLTGYIITGVTAGKLNLVQTYTGGMLVPRWQGVLLNGNAGPYTLKFTGNETTAPTNRISGNTSARTIESWKGSDEQNVKLYKLANGTNGLGWYWDSDNGESLSCGENKGYLWLTQTEATTFNARGFIRLFAGDITGVEEVQEFKVSKVQDGQIYDLQGRFVAQPTKGHLYIVNGKKVILK